MKNFILKTLIALGLVGFFKGIGKQFEAHAVEGREKSAAGICDNIGGRSGGCGKSG
jgi:hypothetical protein